MSICGQHCPTLTKKQCQYFENQFELSLSVRQNTVSDKNLTHASSEEMSSVAVSRKTAAIPSFSSQMFTDVFRVTLDWGWLKVTVRGFGWDVYKTIQLSVQLNTSHQGNTDHKGRRRKGILHPWVCFESLEHNFVGKQTERGLLPSSRSSANLTLMA